MSQTGKESYPSGFSTHFRWTSWMNLDPSPHGPYNLIMMKITWVRSLWVNAVSDIDKKLIVLFQDAELSNFEGLSLPVKTWTMTVHDPTQTENSRDSDVDAHTSGSLTVSDSKRTPLPKLQIFILFLTLFSEPITALVIYPFINQFVRETGITQGDERKTGHYAGIIVR